MVEIQDLSQEIIEIKAIPEEEVKDNHHYYIQGKFSIEVQKYSSDVKIKNEQSLN